MFRQLLLNLSESRDIEAYIRNHPRLRRLITQLVAGESRSEALEVAGRLVAKGRLVSFDYLGEPPRRVAKADQNLEEYLTLIEEAKAADLPFHVAVKPSLLGVGEQDKALYARVEALAQRCEKIDCLLRVDLENFEQAAATLELVRRLHQRYPCIGTVLQSRLRRSDRDLADLNRERIPVRLVKGAYLAPDNEVFHDSEDIDLYYMRLTEGLIHSGTRPAFGTHDEKLIDFVIDLADIFELKKNDFEFQMLYGTRRDLQRKLVEKGYRLRIGIPYGKNWYGYTLRRLADKPAVLWRILKGTR